MDDFKSYKHIRTNEYITMNCNNRIDIKENYIFKVDNELLEILLKDRSSNKNIIWATNNYANRGYGYSFHDEILVQNITGNNGDVIKPRTEKTKDEQLERIRGKAEVFTPSWVCNKQNNLVDKDWFGVNDIFNIEHDNEWVATKDKICFSSVPNKTWKDYVISKRIEITCGEAPYLVSRYDTVTGKALDVSERIGLLDRKLRVVSENVKSESEWYTWTKKAFQSVYGFDWQGDNVLLARENLLFTFVDYYEKKFSYSPSIDYLREIASIISWNIWQMDGMKFVIPGSCSKVEVKQLSFFEELGKVQPCEGCLNNNARKHSGIYCLIKDWEDDRVIEFVTLINNKTKPIL